MGRRRAGVWRRGDARGGGRARLPRRLGLGRVTWRRRAGDWRHAGDARRQRGILDRVLGGQHRGRRRRAGNRWLLHPRQRHLASQHRSSGRRDLCSGRRHGHHPPVCRPAAHRTKLRRSCKPHRLCDSPPTPCAARTDSQPVCRRAPSDQCHPAHLCRDVLLLPVR